MRRHWPQHARPHGRAAFILLTVLGLGLTGVGGAKLGSSLLSYNSARTAQASAAANSRPTAGQSAGDGSASSGAATPTPTPTPGIRPVRIEIAQIHVDAPVQELGLTTTGALAVPTQVNQAGWYTGSALPGQPGPSVIAGHLDSAEGPAVFYGLRELKVGNEISIVLSTGTTVSYHVTGMASDLKSEFPTSAVYGPSPDGELRLITCSGSLVDGSYSDNLIVFARLDNAA
ncbi:MAG TPA: sortase [Actinocrinis sp.]|nr:sortase [Actinocrinis sp.]